MTAVCVILATAVLAALSLCLFLAVEAKASTNVAARMSDLASSRLKELDDLKLAVANASTETALAAEKKQEQRADNLERDIQNAEKRADPAAGLDRLQAAGAEPTGADPSRPSG